MSVWIKHEGQYFREKINVYRHKETGEKYAIIFYMLKKSFTSKKVSISEILLIQLKNKTPIYLGKANKNTVDLLKKCVRIKKPHWYK